MVISFVLLVVQLGVVVVVEEGLFLLVVVLDLRPLARLQLVLGALVEP